MTQSKLPRRRLWFAAKLAVGIGLLVALLLWKDNWRNVPELFAQVQLIYLVPFFGVSLVLIGVSCLKWDLFLRERGVSIPFPRLCGLYTMGYFFNNFFPTMFGGDLVRAHVLGRQIQSQGQSLASVFLERLTGLIALVALGLVSFLFNPELRREPLVAVSVAVVGGGCLLLLVVLWHPGLVRWLTRPLRGNDRLEKWVLKLERLHDHILFFKGRSLLGAKAMAYSFLFHFFTAVNVYVAGRALGMPCGLAELVVVTPIILLVTSLPLTPNSLGVWEWAFSVYLVSAGALPEQGLAVALLLRAKGLVLSLIGGLVFLFEQMPVPSRQLGEQPAG